MTGRYIRYKYKSRFIKNVLFGRDRHRRNISLGHWPELEDVACESLRLEARRKSQSGHQLDWAGLSLKSYQESRENKKLISREN